MVQWGMKALEKAGNNATLHLMMMTIGAFDLMAGSVVHKGRGSGKALSDESRWCSEGLAGMDQRKKQPKLHLYFPVVDAAPYWQVQH